MKRIENFLLYAVIMIMVTLCPAMAYAEKMTTLRIALLDNFTLEKYAQAYKNSYYAGIQTAILAAKKNHISIQFKSFTYGDDPLGVIDAIPVVKAWHPDVIIGPHYSNQFLLLKQYFNNVLVLSPYATDEAISHMPSNFYSLALPDSNTARANFIFIKKYFSGSNIYNISQLDCKDCIDTTKSLDLIYAKENTLVSVKNAVYLGDKINSLNIAELMQGYQKNSVIVLQPLNDLDANILIARVAKFLKDKELVFLYNVDDWGSNGNFQTIVDNANIQAQIFRITPWIINKQSHDYQEFVGNYQEKFHASPNNAVSFMAYNCIMSVVGALQKYPSKDTMLNVQASVLASYLSALKQNKNWYRGANYAIYEYTHKHDVLHKVISTNDYF